MVTSTTTDRLVCVAGSLLLLLYTAQGFIPNKNGRFRDSIAHDLMTDNAVRRLAVIFMNEHPDIFPDQDEAMATDDFILALENFKLGSAIPDTEESLINYPPAHFDAEQIVLANQKILDQRVEVINAINGDDSQAAQQITGQLLHTLQDFYSHTNWVEMGNTDINRALGDPDQLDNIGQVATLDEPTCVDCDDRTCNDNIRSEINSAEILTSGYVYLKGSESRPDPNDYKPAGRDKCSHGGRDDITADSPATGGINKDTLDDKFSPHHYLHQEAAKLAETASLEFLKGIRQIRTDKEFAKYLGLAFGASLCYIIDTTGSMGTEIDAVKKITIEITEAVSDGDNPPSNYVMVPFNDPDYGPLYATTDPDQMIRWLGNLTATGGGDAPEMFFSGTIIALENVRPGSTCYAFTDAPAKDIERIQEALALAMANRVKVILFYTGSDGRHRSNQKSTSKGQTSRKHNQIARRRHKRTTTELEYYEEFAMATGGQVIKTSDSEIEEAVKVVQVGLSTTEVTLLQHDNIIPNGTVGYELPIDETLTDVVISITGVITTVEILNANGLIESPGAPDSGATVIVESDVSTVKLFTIASPSPGVWRVRVTPYTDTHSISVTASSLVSFSYHFVHNVTSGHGGYKELAGKPVAGEEEILVANIYSNPPTSTKSSRGISHVTDLLLVASDGAQLQQHPPLELRTLSEYQITAVLPTQGFRVVLRGLDSQGNVLQRSDPSLVATSSITVSLAMGTSGGFSVMPGDVIDVNITLSNSGSADVYVLHVSDSEGFYETVDPERLTVSPGVPVTAVATFRAPGDASLGLVSTVTITASSASDTNFVVFRLTTTSKTSDSTAPVCTTGSSGNTGDCSDSQFGNTPCDQDHWYMDFSVRDTGIGLHNIKPSELLDPSSQLTVDTYSPGTTEPVNGRYSSTCCHPNVTIVASDALGNAGRCHLQHDASSGASGVAALVEHWRLKVVMVITSAIVTHYL